MDPRPGTLTECKKLFTYFSSPIVRKALNHVNTSNNRRIEYINSIIKDGVEKYMECTNAPDDRCVTGKYHIQLFKANKPEEIAEYILSGFGFEVQREMFGS